MLARTLQQGSSKYGKNCEAACFSSLGPFGVAVNVADLAGAGVEGLWDGVGGVWGMIMSPFSRGKVAGGRVKSAVCAVGPGSMSVRMPRASSLKKTGAIPTLMKEEGGEGGVRCAAPSSSPFSSPTGRSPLRALLRDGKRQGRVQGPEQGLPTISVAIEGPPGSGKTTLMAALAREMAFVSGAEFKGGGGGGSDDSSAPGSGGSGSSGTAKATSANTGPALSTIPVLPLFLTPYTDNTASRVLLSVFQTMLLIQVSGRLIPSFSGGSVSSGIVFWYFLTPLLIASPVPHLLSSSAFDSQRA